VRGCHVKKIGFFNVNGKRGFRGDVGVLCRRRAGVAQRGEFCVEGQRPAGVSWLCDESRLKGRWGFHCTMNRVSHDAMGGFMLEVNGRFMMAQRKS
jgi:hypothetical protein